MITVDRLADPAFAPEEVLVQRCKKCHLEKDGKTPAPAAFPSPSYSVNRTKYGPAEDVLVPRRKYDGYGFFTYLVREIPPPIVSLEIEYVFTPVHLPEEFNFHHSEVQVFVQGRRLDNAAPKNVTKTMRIMAARVARLQRAPTV